MSLALLDIIFATSLLACNSVFVNCLLISSMFLSSRSFEFGTSVLIFLPEVQFNCNSISTRVVPSLAFAFR